MTGLDRDTAKAVNFAKIYGAGVKKFAEMIGKPLAEAQAIVAQYDAKLPFVSQLSAICQEKAVRIGYTVLYDGARRHWNLYEVPRIYAKGAGPCALEEARRRMADPEHPWYGQRYSAHKTYTALNALIQGSAARHTKLWMRACWREGIVPLLQMHDCSGMLGDDARAGRAGRAARLRSRHARGADEGRSEVRPELGRRQAHLGRSDRRQRASAQPVPSRLPKPAPVQSARSPAIVIRAHSRRIATPRRSLRS